MCHYQERLNIKVKVLLAQSCLILCNPTDCSPPGSSVRGDSPGQTTRVGCHSLLQGIFPTQRLNPCLLHCRRILCPVSHQGSSGWIYIHPVTLRRLSWLYTLETACISVRKHAQGVGYNHVCHKGTLKTNQIPAHQLANRETFEARMHTAEQR